MTIAKVVIVDDEMPIREDLRMFSWMHYDFELVGEARNGQEALELCLSTNTDIVVTDIVMPVMDGLQLTHALKQWNKDVQIILLTCHREFDYVKEALSLGACDYLLKGTYRNEDLVAALTRAKGRLPERELDELVDKRFEIKKALTFVHERLGDLLTLSMIAEHVELSENYFSNLFRKEMGEGFQDYLKRIRLAKAAYLLRHSNMKVYEVAARTGFPNYRYFTEIFRKQFGKSPREYRDYL